MKYCTFTDFRIPDTAFVLIKPYIEPRCIMTEDNMKNNTYHFVNKGIIHIKIEGELYQASGINIKHIENIIKVENRYLEVLQVCQNTNYIKNRPTGILYSTNGFNADDCELTYEVNLNSDYAWEKWKEKWTDDFTRDTKDSVDYVQDNEDYIIFGVHLKEEVDGDSYNSKINSYNVMSVTCESGDYVSVKHFGGAYMKWEYVPEHIKTRIISVIEEYSKEIKRKVERKI